jgi:MarR family transcriptional regulator for hemolysin
MAKLANVEQPTMAKLLSRLERDGLVATSPHPEDRRARQVSLTRKARTAFPTGVAMLMEAEQQVLAELSKAEQKQLKELLQRVLNTVETLNAATEAECP